jgi:erythromycin esterase
MTSLTRTAAVVRPVASIAFIGLCLYPPPSRAQHQNAGFEQWAAANAIPLASIEPAKTTSDLRRLGSMIGSARIVTIGEPTHGAHEPLAFRNRLFRYLVEELGFTAIAIESGLPESRHVHAFVETGVGDAKKIAHEHISYEWGDWQENVELIQWMRDYNANPARRQKIRFYGFDLSLGGATGATPRPAPFEAALSLLSRADSASATRLRQALQPILRLPPGPAPSLTTAEREAGVLAVDELLSRLERNRPSLQATTSAEDYEWGSRSALVAQQVARMLRVMPSDLPSDRIPPSAWELVETRDAGMADNIRWILSREGPNGRILVFAHNGHVETVPFHGGVWNAFAKPPNSLGVHLRSFFKDSLVTIVTSSATNGAGVPSAALDSTSLDASLARVGHPRFFLDLRAARNNPMARTWLAQERPFRANFTMYLSVIPSSAFDVVVFVDTLTAAIKTSP